MKIGIIGITGKMGRELIRTCLSTVFLERNAKKSQLEEDLPIPIVAGCISQNSSYFDHENSRGENFVKFMIDERIVDETFCKYQYKYDDADIFNMKNGMVPDKLQHGDFYLTTSIEEVFEKSDIVIDYSTPKVFIEACKVAEKTGKILFSGTTGLLVKEKDQMLKCAQNAKIVHCHNSSISVNLMLSMVQKVSSLLGDEFDVEIYEEHHNKKVDSPSGTAVSLGAAVARGRKKYLEDLAVFSRHGANAKRKKGEIGFSAARLGKVVGTHTVIFDDGKQRIELKHQAHDRIIFAEGAIIMAYKAFDKIRQNGIYSVEDILNIKFS